jgi:TonB family protein
MRRALHRFSLILGLLLVVETLGQRGVSGAAQVPEVYVAPNLRICDPATPEGWDARVNYLSPKPPIESAPKAPWQGVLERATTNPQSVLAQLDLARCYASFYRGILETDAAVRIRSVIQRGVALVHAEQANAQPAALASRSSGDPVRVGVDVPLTRKTKDRVPTYPADAMGRHQFGIVFVDAAIDPKGKVRRTTIVGSVPRLDNAAKDAVGRWEFEPVLVNGRPVDAVRLMTVKFSAKEGPDPVDGIDIARFHYTRGAHLEAIRALEQASRDLAEALASPHSKEVRLPLATGAFAESVRRGELGEGIKMPVVLVQEKPSYTEAAMSAKIQGTVHLEILILADGTVGDVLVRKSLDPTFGLDFAAVKAASKWRFRPARDARGAVPVVADLIMDFNLH